jgi:hypothetical protein
VVQRWTANGFDGISSWLGSNSEHPLYDETTLAFAFRAAESDPEAAREWSATIKNPAIRQQADQMFAARDEAAARNAARQQNR